MQQREKFSISQGPSECFLIFDDDLGMKTTFYKYLSSEGFSPAYPNYGDSGIKHCYVNITRRQYAYGKAGVKLGEPIGNASITIKEFRTIWNIYKKHLKAGECFDHRDEPFIYQSKNVRESRQRYEEEQRRMEKLRKQPHPPIPHANLEQLIKEYPGYEKLLRVKASKGATEGQLREWLYWEEY